MKTPPKDGTVILGTFKNYPTPLACMWNGANLEWVAAIPQAMLYEGEYNDHYFENEYFAEEELENWREI